MCHGLEGYTSIEKFPVLAGQREVYIVKQLTDFRQEKRSNDGGQMQGIVEEITESDLRIVAEYFSKQDRPVVERERRRSELWLQGRELYQRSWLGDLSCADCHDSGNVKAGQRVQAPVVFGQHRAYLDKQLKDFKSGLRANDANAVMRSVTASVSEQDIDALAEYLHLGDQCCANK